MLDQLTSGGGQAGGAINFYRARLHVAKITCAHVIAEARLSIVSWVCRKQDTWELRRSSSAHASFGLRDGSARHIPLNLRAPRVQQADIKGKAASRDDKINFNDSTTIIGEQLSVIKYTTWYTIDSTR